MNDLPLLDASIIETAWGVKLIEVCGDLHRTVQTDYWLDNEGHHCGHCRIEQERS